MKLDRKSLAWAVALASASTAVTAEPVVLGDTLVTASPLNRDLTQMTTPAAVLQGDDWFRLRETGLANSLESIPGVRSSDFGPGASRPVIRGLDGARVRVLNDGTDVLDASTISPDHAVTADTLLLERVEVLKGPATLMYGGGAIGGVVNVIDRRIPTYVPDRGIEGELALRGNTVADERAGAFGLTMGAGQFAARIEGSRSEADPYRIPDSPSRQTGAFNDTDSVGAGLSWITERGFVGLGYTRQSREYGLLAHEHADCHTHGTEWHCGSHGHGHGHGHGHDDHDNHEHHADHDHHDHHHDHLADIEMIQRRWDLRADYRDPFAGFERLRVRISDADYRHSEFDDSVVGTRFSNRGTEGRVELTHAPLAGWRGVVGTQLSRRDFAAVGDEAYVPPTLTHNRALFLLEEFEAGDWRYELGARHEWQEIDVKRDAERTSHRGNSLSLGATWQWQPELALFGSLSRSQRLPTAEELYANGPHAATRTVELGNPDLDNETAHNVELGLRYLAGPWTLDASVFRDQVSDFIFAADTGRDPEGGYREIEYRQADAVLRGVEGSARLQATDSLGVTLFGDQVRGRLRSGGDLPRIPADRLGMRLDQRFTTAVSGDVEAYRVRRQNDIAAFETETAGYTMVNAGLSYRGSVSDAGMLLYLRGGNLLNEKARQHSSFIKDEVLLPGRNLTVGARFSF